MLTSHDWNPRSRPGLPLFLVALILVGGFILVGVVVIALVTQHNR